MTRPPDLESWIHPRLSIRRSSIDGAGLFATGRLRQGEVVIRFGGFLFGADKRFDTSTVQQGSVIGLAEDVVLAEPLDNEKDRSDYINHSCSPNLGLRDALTVVLLKDVVAGEELTTDYAFWETDANYVMKVACNCRSAACRGQITGTDWQLPELRGQILTSAAPFIRRRIF